MDRFISKKVYNQSFKTNTNVKQITVCNISKWCLHINSWSQNHHFQTSCLKQKHYKMPQSRGDFVQGPPRVYRSSKTFWTIHGTCWLFWNFFSQLCNSSAYSKVLSYKSCLCRYNTTSCIHSNFSAIQGKMRQVEKIFWEEQNPL